MVLLTQLGTIRFQGVKGNLLHYNIAMKLFGYEIQKAEPEVQASAEVYNTLAYTFDQGYSAGATLVYNGERSYTLNRDLSVSLPAVYDCATLLAGILSSLPVKIINTETKREIKADGSPSGTVLGALIHDEIHPSLTTKDMFEAWILDFLLDGNGLFVVRKNNRRKFQGLELVDATGSLAGTHKDFPGRIAYHIISRDRYEYEMLPDSEIIHARAPMVRRSYGNVGNIGTYWGCSPIQVCSRAVGLGVQSEIFISNYFRDGLGSTDVVMPPAGKNMNTPNVQDMREFHKEYSKGNRELVVAKKNMEIKRLNSEPQTKGVAELRYQVIEEVARIYKVPAVYMLLKIPSVGSGIAELNKLFHSTCLGPMAHRLESAFSKPTLPRGFRLQFDFTKLLRGSLAEMAEAVSKLRGEQGQPPLFLSSELRHMTGHPDLSPEEQKQLDEEYRKWAKEPESAIQSKGDPDGKDDT